MTDIELITASVERSGQSGRVFAEYLLAGRDVRTVERWKAGQVPIPPRARDYLTRWLAFTDRQRDALMRTLIPECERAAAAARPMVRAS